MLINHPLEVENLNNLHLDIYTIGYSNEGEAILTLLCNASEVLYAVLTDCYEENDYNYVSEVLNELNVKNIDAFIWTHPDEDHSIGIPNILAKYDPDNKAQLFLPAALNKHMGIKEEAQKALDYIMQHYNHGRVYDVNYISLNTDEAQKLLLSLKIEVMKPRTTIYCRYNFLLPSAAIIARRLNAGTNIYMNDLSIFYIVTFNDFNYVFCGDLSEQNVKFIKDELLENIVFIKIPHHGSDSLKTFVPKLISRGISGVISTTTTFRRKNLPKDEVLTEYKKISNGVYSTGRLKNQQSVGPYGCVTTKFYTTTMEPQIEITGNAYCVYRT